MRNLRKGPTAFGHRKNSRAAARIGAFLVVSCTTLAIGTTVAAPPAEARSVTYNLDIPSQSLNDALQALALASHHKLLYSSELVEGKNSPAIKGQFTAEQAVEALLSGSKLAYEVTSDGLVLIRAAGEAASSKATDSKPTSMSIAPAGPSALRLAQDSGARSAGQPEATRPAESPDGPGASKEASGPKLEEIIVTANKRAESTLDVAGSVQVVTSEQLDKISATKLSDYAAFIPGLQIQPSQWAGQQTIILRGIAPQQSAPTVTTYIDDVAVGGTSNQGSGSTGLADIDPSELQRVEVLNGPQGTLYGASSLGGVVKFVTRAPNLETTEGSVSVDGFSVDHGDLGTELRARISAPLIQDTLGVSLSGHYRKDPGYLDDIGLGGPKANDGETYGVHGSLLFIPAENWDVRLGALLSKQESNSDNAIIIDSATRQPVYGRYTQDHFAPSNGSNEIELYSATINHQLENSGATVTSASSYSKTTQKSLFDPFNLFQTEFGLPVPTANATISYPVEQVTQELRLTSAKNGKFEWLAGGYYQHEQGNPFTDYFATSPTGVPIVLPPPLNPFYSVSRDYQVREFAGFGNASYYFLHNLWLTLGYRYSDIKQHDAGENLGFFANPAAPDVPVPKDFREKEDKSTYLATLSYKLTPDVELYTRAASGYRPGGSRNAPPGAGSDFSTSYKSDSIWNYEAGAKGMWPGYHLSGSVAVYWIDWSDIQENFKVGTSNFDEPGNGGNARSRGVEAQVGYEPVKGLRLTADVSYTDAIFLQANPANNVLADQLLPDTAKWTAGFATEYEYQLAGEWKGLAGGDVQIKSRSITVDRFEQDGYQTVGLHLGAQRGGFSASFYVRNLFDQYRIIAGFGAVGVAPYEAGILAPRVIGISLNQKF